MDAHSNSIASVLTQLKKDSADAVRVAVVVVEKMQAIHAALAPVIGDRGVSALYRRSLFLMGREAAWAQSLYAQGEIAGDYTSLRSAISGQTDAEALSSAEAIFSNIFDVLVDLIGTALTERLLQPIYHTPPAGTPSRKISHD
ncbi:MAG: hypothetical protein NVV68_03650 [Dokdonella sp.]|jgi:hypothetical protein|nr:hypothetical protein [Dokdonella sp.]